MTKLELYKAVVERVDNVFILNKVPKAAKEEIKAILEQYLKPKTNSVVRPPITLGEGDDKVTYHYCRYHQMYEPEADMVMSNNKSKGYCKAAISVWNKNNARIKKLNELVSKYLGEGNLEKAQESNEKAQELKKNLNLPSSFDYVKDYMNFYKISEDEAKKKKLELEKIG